MQRAILIRGLAISAMGLLRPDSALAGISHYGHERAEADIEDLDAELRYLGEEWDLSVDYEVEIEDARRGQQFDLVFSLRERSRGALTPRGKAMRIIMPLDRPVELDDDEMEFSGCIGARLPRDLIRRPDRLRIHAAVVPRGGGPALDTETESVAYRD